MQLLGAVACIITQKDKGNDMFCSQCGTGALPTAKFCQKCGAYFPVTPSNEAAIEETRLLQSHETPKTAPPVSQTPQSRPERTPEQDSPQGSESSASTLWKPSSKAGFWMPLIVMVLSMKLVGALGAIVGYVTYTYVRARRGLWIALTAAIFASLSTAFIAGFIFEASGVLRPNKELAQEKSASQDSAVKQQANPNTLTQDWTQKNTGSAEAGPWLDYTPADGHDNELPKASSGKCNIDRFLNNDCATLDPPQQR